MQPSSLAHIAVALVLPPLLPGIIARTKAAFAGRQGPPVLQLYYDLAKQIRKGTVLSGTTTWVFFAGPVVAVAAGLIASVLVPFGSASAPASFTGDIVLFTYLFALSRFFVASSALDTGSAFEGMGAAREVSFAALAEPALFLGFLVGMRLTGSLSLSAILSKPWAGGRFDAGASLVLVLVSWFIVLLAENCRIPVDDPNTHLELTMIHEVMVLDHSGPLFGLVLYGAALKLMVFGALLVRLVLPIAQAGPLLSWVAFCATLIGLAVVIGVIESIIARLRLVRVPMLLVTACLLSAFALILLFR